MINFILVGLKSPGRVNLPVFGTVELENISDDLAERIFKQGCRYLQPTAEYRKKLYPDEKPITVTRLNLKAQKPAKQ